MIFHAHAYRVKLPFIGFCTTEELLKAQKIHGIDKSEVMPNMRTDDPKVQNLFRAAEKVGFSVTTDGSDQLDGDVGLYDDTGLP
ncbi:MAG: hypothetical protein IJX80_08025 [Clostridia bacterium]|nr:hypothetical protein [Clostridia bacterium]